MHGAATVRLMCTHRALCVPNRECLFIIGVQDVKEACLLHVGRGATYSSQWATPEPRSPHGACGDRVACTAGEQRKVTVVIQRIVYNASYTVPHSVSARVAVAKNHVCR